MPRILAVTQGGARMRHATFSAGLDPQNRSILALDSTDENCAACEFEVSIRRKWLPGFLDILLAMNDEDSYGRGGVFHPLASVGSWAECLTSAAHVSAGVTFGLPAHRSLRRREVYDDALIKGKPYILGLKRRGFTAKNGKLENQRVVANHP
jgi:hypothetical protein